ncbi:MAG: Gx transporter family protein [Acutalibacteraceae bacterium]|nr:Gx transporter family protein [Acutalibacteraceae bacterium]
MKAKRITLLSLFCALAMIMSYLESLIPLPLPFGIKVGLPNIIIVFILYRVGAVSAFAVSIVRVILVSLLFGNALSLLYSLAGAVLSLTLMIILKSIKSFSTVGVSVIGGIAHNAGQIIVACVVMDTAQISYYLPILAIAGTVAGVLVGIAGNLLITKIRKI